MQASQWNHPVPVEMGGSWFKNYRCVREFPAPYRYMMMTMMMTDTYELSCVPLLGVDSSCTNLIPLQYIYTGGHASE
jgi:hypothetical protein